MALDDIFKLFGLARMRPAGSSTTFQLRATSNTHAMARRLAIRKRPEEEGAPIDDVGADPHQFSMIFLFARSDSELTTRVGEATYPQYHARFLREVDKPGTATLYVPGRGEKRVRWQSLTSSQVPNERDCETVSMTFLVDKEDGRAGIDSFNLPSAKTAPPILLQQFLNEAVAIGMGGDLLSQLEDAIDRLEAAINSPFDAAADVASHADRVLGLCGRIRKLATAPVQPFPGGGFAPLALAESVGPLALLAQVEDAAAAQRTAILGTASTRPRRFTRSLSIFEIATLTGQPVDELIRLNGRLPLFGIPPGVEVIVRTP